MLKIKYGRLTLTFVCLLLIHVSTTSYYAPRLTFFRTVINREKVTEVFSDPNVTRIVFQHTNLKSDAPSGQRHKYRLIAYKEMGGRFERIPNDGFIVSYFRQVPIEVDSDGATSIFGNLILRRTDLPAALPNFRFIILHPRPFTARDEKEYVHYQMYYAENQNDAPPATSGITPKSVLPIDNTLNPSPPRGID